MCLFLVALISLFASSLAIGGGARAQRSLQICRAEEKEGATIVDDTKEARRKTEKASKEPKEGKASKESKEGKPSKRSKEGKASKSKKSKHCKSAKGEVKTTAADDDDEEPVDPAQEGLEAGEGPADDSSLPAEPTGLCLHGQCGCS